MWINICKFGAEKYFEFGSIWIDPAEKGGVRRKGRKEKGRQEGREKKKERKEGRNKNYGRWK